MAKHLKTNNKSNKNYMRYLRNVILFIVSPFVLITRKKSSECPFLQNIINTVSNPIFVKDRNHKWILLNDAFCKSMGYKRNKLIGKSDYDFFPKEEADVFWKKDEIVFKTKKENTNEEFFTDAKGITRTILTKKDVYTDENGNPILVGVITDITESKETEKQLMENEKIFKDLYETSMTLSGTTNEVLSKICRKVHDIFGGFFVLVNYAQPSEFNFKSGCNLPEKIVKAGKEPIKNAICSHVLNTKKPLFTNKLKTEKCPVCKVPYKKDAAVEAFDLNSYFGVPLIFSDGKLHGTLCIVYKKKIKPFTERDTQILKMFGKRISIELEKEEAEEKLKESEEKYKILYSSSKDAIMILEPPTWKFTAGNPATIKMFGAKNESDFISRAPWQYSPKHQPDGKLSSVKAKKIIIKAMKEGTNFFEWTHKRLNGEEFLATVLLTKFKLKDKEVLQATVRDISERKKAKEKLLESKLRYQTIFEQGTDSIVLIDPKKDVIVEFNEKAYKSLGYTRKEFQNIELTKIEAIQSKQEIKKQTKKALIKGGAFFETKHKKRNGEIRDILVNAKSIFIEGKEFIYATFRDITKKKQLEHTVNERHKELQGLYSFAKLSSSISDIDEMLMECVNNAPFAWQYPEYTCARIKFGKKEFKTNNFRKTKQFQSAPIIVSGNVVGKIEVCYLKKFHQKKGVKGPFMHEEGRLIHGLADILGSTIERRNVRNKIQISEARYRGIVEDQTEHICRLTPNGTITFVNSACYDYFGEKHGKGLIGKNFMSLVFKADHSLFEGYFDSFTVRKPVKTIEHRVILPNGEIRYEYWVHRAIFDKSGNLTGFQAIGNDITKEKELEKMKSELVSIVSHQLRTPLTNIKWISKLLLKGKMGKLLKKQEEFVKDISESNKRMISLVNDFLNIARIEKEIGTKLHRKIENLIPLIKEVIKEMTIPLEENRMKIIFTKALPEKELVMINKQKTLEVLKNIIGNAIKYSPKGSTLRINFKHKNGQFVLSVKDHGIGIPKNQHKHIFTKFFRAQNAIEKFPEGSGLGLYAAKSFIEAQGGKLWFTSVKNNGTVFYVSLPKPIHKNKNRNKKKK